MKQVSHYNKVMWGLYCEYSYLKPEVYEYTPPWTGRVEWRVRTSKENWDWIHSKYYYVTKIDPIFNGSVEDFRRYLEYRTYRNGHRRSPYNYKKNMWSSGQHQCGKRTYRWRWTCGERTKEQKKPKYVQKKTISEEEVRKREWKKKVKDPRDQGTRFYRKKRRQNSCTLGNRAERREVKAELKLKDWKDYGPRWWSQEYGHEMIWNYHCAPNDWDSYSIKGKRAWVDPYDWD